MVTTVNEQSKMFTLTHPRLPTFHECPDSLWVGAESGTIGVGLGLAQKQALGRMAPMAAGKTFEDDASWRAVPFNLLRVER